MARQTASYLCEIATHLKIAHYASPPLCFFKTKKINKILKNVIPKNCIIK